MFAPSVPFGGPAGYAFLQRTSARQQEALAQSPTVSNLTEHFAERIGEVKTADALMSDRRLREVALGAFGLSEDIDNIFYIRSVLEQGTGEGSLASRIADKRYAKMAEAFGFDRTGETELDRILLFDPAQGPEEIALEHDGRTDLRLGVVLERKLGAIAERTGTRTVETGEFDARGQAITRTEPRELSEDDRWESALFDPALRRSFEAALDLPQGFKDLALPDRVAAMRAAAREAFGDDTLTQFASPEGAAALTARVLSRIGPPTGADGFAERITALYEERAFEAAVGEQHPSLRLALNLERELTELAGRDASERTKWFTVMGTPPLRKVFETAFGLPTAFGTLDVDQQLTTFQDRAEALFGSPDVSRFADPEARGELTRRFLALSQLEQGVAGATSAAGTALAILTGGV